MLTNNQLVIILTIDGSFFDLPEFILDSAISESAIEAALT